ncbi:MAG: hypothetical protein J5845_05060 [Lachnospiraceae bacterium]|nr:hypothetical protein [Lachnospiraceae bacterium]
MKKGNPIYVVFVCIMLFGPIVAGTVLLINGQLAGGLLMFLVPVVFFGTVVAVRKHVMKKSFYKIKDAHTRFDVIPVKDYETLEALRDNSALTFWGEPNITDLDKLYNWLNNEGVLKEERLKLYTFDGRSLKNAFQKNNFGDEERFMSIFLKDLELTEANKRQFSLDRMNIGGRWLDDMIDNA